MTARRLRIRYEGHCSGCGRALAAGTTALWDKDTKQLTCAACESSRPEAAVAVTVEQVPEEAKPDAGRAVKRIRLRKDGACSGCGSPLDARGSAWWDPSTKALCCDGCHQDPAANSSTLRVADRAVGVVDTTPVPAAPTSSAGGSAQRKYHKLSDQREQRIHQDHPVVGGLILALSNEPQSTTAWARGATGERQVAAMLDRLAGEGVVALHDRRIPRRRANIDHLAVAPSGVWVIDAKHYRGQVAKRDVGGWFTTDLRLYVGRRDCTRLVRAMAGQVEAARSALGPHWAEVAIHPLLCFVGAEWSLLAKPFTLEGVTVAWPKATARLLRRPGTLTLPEVAQVAGRLAQSLPPAS